MILNIDSCDWSARVKEAQERIKLSDEAAGLSTIEEVSDM